MRPVRPCRLIEISGAPFERGRQYGRLAAAEVKNAITHYAAQVRQLKLRDDDLLRVVRQYQRAIESFEPRYIEEMRGIAEGAEVEFDHVVMLNTRTEVLKLAAHPDLRTKLLGAAELDGCTTVVAQPEATAAGRLIHAHNWDWKRESAEASVVLHIRDADGPDILTFTEAGALGRFGFNSLGIAISGNYLESDRDYAQLGVPLALIRRKVLEQTHYALALRFAYVTPKSGSNNIVISHAGGGMVFDFECAPDESFEVEPKDGLLIHANHWRSPVALVKLRETGIASTPDSLCRERRARNLLASKIGRITVADVKATLLDDWGSPWSICRPPLPSSTSDLTATVITLIMQPSAGTMEIAVLPALDPTFTSYTMEMESTARSDAKHGASIDI
jgi:isopenicillin-N N-acyltransferase like protein